MKPLHIAFILFIDCLWAANIVAVKVAIEAVGPLTAVTLRYLIVVLVCLPWVRWLPGRMVRIVGTGIIAGALFMGLGSLSFALADNVAALAIAGQVGVPLSLILAVIFYRERIRWPRITGIVLAFAGVAMLLFDPHIFNERIALLLTLAASFCWAVGNLLFRRLQGVHVLNLHGWLGLVSVPLLAAGSLWFEPGELVKLGAVTPEVWGWLAYSAIASSIVGHAGMTWLFQRYPVSTVAPLTLPTPLLSVGVSVLAFDIALTWEMVAGGLVTLVGVAIITLRTAQARTPAPVTEAAP